MERGFSCCIHPFEPPMTESLRTPSRLMDRRVFESDYHPLRWKTALGWERDGIIRVVRIGRRCFLIREEIEKLIAEGGKQFADGWRRVPAAG
jgi:hypothetical protein